MSDTERLRKVGMVLIAWIVFSTAVSIVQDIQILHLARRIESIEAKETAK